jgi:hypothetical protein
VSDDVRDQRLDFGRLVLLVLAEILEVCEEPQRDLMAARAHGFTALLRRTDSIRASTSALLFDARGADADTTDLCSVPAPRRKRSSDSFPSSRV